MTIKKPKTASPTKKPQTAHMFPNSTGESKEQSGFNLASFVQFRLENTAIFLLFSMNNDSIKMPIENTRHHCC